jgi:hypothetical protein
MNSSKRVTNIYMTKMMVCIVAVVSLGFLLLQNICSSEEPLVFFFEFILLRTCCSILHNRAMLDITAAS